MRATMLGLADAVADPETAATLAIERNEANGNPNDLQPDGEIFRWTTDAELIIATTPEGSALGVPDPALLQAELDAYATVGFFGDEPTPDASSLLDNTVIGAIYDGASDPIFPE